MALTSGGERPGSTRSTPKPKPRTRQVTQREARSLKSYPAPRRSKPAPTPPRPAPRTPSGSAPRSTPRSSPGKVSSIGAPSKAPAPKPTPKPPNVKSYLAGDVTYQDLLRGQQRTLSDFLADITRQRGEAKTSFGDVTRSMETERDRALEAMMNEYASRGLLQSGLFGEAQGNYQQDWQNQMTSLEQGQQSLLGDLLSQQTNFKREQGLASEAARQDAIRRRASKYGLT